MTKQAYLTIHGHFYQPPRENPWMERIERQPDAHPFHDWNDRILVQCYQPNAMSRIVDRQGKVLEIVNNFRLLSFNVGPTLLSWLERYAPIVYRRILEGDRLSQQERSGHGNALAQVYNHMILPLASERDQRTQIRWGILEFRKRFNREPEGMWLPECACNERTLEILIEEGIRFTILAPEQAERIRPLAPAPTGSWQDVSGGKIDPTRPYRFFHRQDSKKWMDLFFFDGPLSRDVSFGNLLFDAQKLIERLKAARHPERHHPELIHLACDGETFGHHKAFGERVVTYILHNEAERQGFKRTHYGEYLEKFPPQHEVQIKGGEGTSWSCPHGIERWRDDCGCEVGGLPGWNQKWRRPLREAIQFLEQKLGEVYERETREIFHDPWAARDGYAEAVLDRSLEGQEKFLSRFAAKPLTVEEKIRTFKSLEMQRYAMLAETSCGWFFNDLAGIETVQILRYALRALELARELGQGNLEEEFLGRLQSAQSNREEVGDGRAVWEKLVKTSGIPPEKLVAHYAFLKLFESEPSHEDFYHHRIEEGEAERETEGEKTLLMGSVTLTNKSLPEPRTFLYAILHTGISQVQCFVRRETRLEEFHRLNVAPLTLFRRGQVDALRATLGESFGGPSFLLRDLFPEERDRILIHLSRRLRSNLMEAASDFYDENRAEMTLFHNAGSPLPEELQGLMAWMMGEQLLEYVKRLESEPHSEIEKKANHLYEESSGRGFVVRKEPAIEFLSAYLNRCVERLFQKNDTETVQRLGGVLQLAQNLQLRLHDRIAQDLFFVFAQKVLREEGKASLGRKGSVSQPERIQAVIRLGGELGFNMEPHQRQLENEKTRIKG